MLNVPHHGAWAPALHLVLYMKMGKVQYYTVITKPVLHSFPDNGKFLVAAKIAGVYLSQDTCTNYCTTAV